MFNFKPTNLGFITCLIPIAIFVPLLSSIAMPLYSKDTILQNSGTKATLVELFSSEGCNSCPPAEAWISSLKSSPALWINVFPVVFHVDYWDSLGWPDRFAKPAYTQRQRNYAAQLGQDSIYTPEFVVSGYEWRGWFKGERIPSARTETSGTLALQVKARGKKISVLYLPSSKASSETYTVCVVLLGINILNDVKSGENRGRHLRHDFVALDFESKPLTTPSFQSGPIDLKSSTDDPPGAVVAWVSKADGSIVQIAGGWLKPSDQPAGSSINATDPVEANLR